MSSSRLTICTAAVLTVACGDGTRERDFGPPQSYLETSGASAVYLRLRNASDVSFDAVGVGWLDDLIDFGALPGGGVSEYLEVEGALDYGYVQAKSGGAEYLYQPTDYAGARSLEVGYYTYRLTPVQLVSAGAEGSLDIFLFPDRAPRSD